MHWKHFLVSGGGGRAFSIFRARGFSKSPSPLLPHKEVCAIDLLLNPCLILAVTRKKVNMHVLTLNSLTVIPVSGPSGVFRGLGPYRKKWVSVTTAVRMRTHEDPTRVR